jgi:hypothetical protein
VLNFDGLYDRTRTCGLRLRRPVLYPLSYAEMVALVRLELTLNGV